MTSKFRGDFGRKLRISLFFSLLAGNTLPETGSPGLRSPPGSRREPPWVPGAHNPSTELRERLTALADEGDRGHRQRNRRRVMRRRRFVPSQGVAAPWGGG